MAIIKKQKEIKFNNEMTAPLNNTIKEEVL